jgi:hypothetical protein
LQNPVLETQGRRIKNLKERKVKIMKQNNDPPLLRAYPAATAK